MEKEFVTYELAVKLKALGFDEPCLKTMLDFDITYESDVKMPLYQQAFRWFREKYKQSHIWMMDELLDTGEYTYEEAELACLEKLIEIVENK